MLSYMKASHAAHALSVVPPQALVSSFERIQWLGSVSPRSVSGQLPLANSVNKHDYKPAFVRSGANLLCHVAGPDGRDQVLRAWALLGYGKVETTSDTSSDTLVAARDILIRAISPVAHRLRGVVIARLESFLHARDLASLLYRRIKTVQAARVQLIAYEIGRIENEFRPRSPLDSRVSDAHTFVRTAWLPEESLIVVNLPWGPKLSAVVAEVVGNLGCDVDVVVVGGAGAVSIDLPVESVFVPNSIRSPDGSVSSVNNILMGEFGKLGIQFAQGCLGSVPSALYSQSSHLDSSVDAVETELAYMSPLWANTRTFGTAQYIMDNIGRNLPLSSTYYHQPWLTTLARRVRRAKNLCLAAVISKYGIGAELLVRL